MPQTVIILGAARSGTKFLRDLLGAGRAARVVPHDVNYVWRHGNERHEDDALPASAATATVARFVRSRLSGLAGMRGDEDEVLVEKTVSNTLRVDFVRAVYPDARLVHLVRDGRAVVESSLRQWSSRPEWKRLMRKALTMNRSDFGYGIWVAGNLVRGMLRGRAGGRIWGPRYPGISEDVASLPLIEVCAKQWRACVEATLEGLDRAPPELVHTIRYEELMQGPESLERLAAFLDFPDPGVIVDRYRSVRIAGIERKWREAFSSEDEARVGRVVEPLMERLAYQL